MKSSFVILLCLATRWSEVMGGKVVADLRASSKEKDIETYLKAHTNFLFFCNEKISSIFSFVKNKELKEHQEIGAAIKDTCIFQPGGASGKQQKGFRRSEIVMKYDPKTLEKDTKIYHHSLRLNAKAPLNTTHQYLLGSLEGSKGNCFYDIAYGTVFDGKVKAPKPDKDAEFFKVRDFSRKVIHKVKASPTEIVNFAIEIDYKKKTLQVYSSTGDKKLQKQGKVQKISEEAIKENLGKGELHAQLIKFPMPDPAQTLENTNNVPFFGLHPKIKGKEEVFHSRNFVEEAPITLTPDGPTSNSTTTSTKPKKTKETEKTTEPTKN
ncbi:hypothetical protein DFH28DRAFT_964560 [Melampsora americana]|nr:hypothetical protein DFH28DRAFT_964560 [Melampsora americana]